MDTFTDNSGRLAITVVIKNDEKLIIVNVYVPCDPVVAKAFMETVYDKVYETMDRHPDAFLIMGGDFNACMDVKLDSLNRNKTVSEQNLTDFIISNNATCEITDSYRAINPTGGYTWTRQTCQSRLDYIFMSNYLMTK